MRDALSMNNRQTLELELFDTQRDQYRMAEADSRRLDPYRKHDDFVLVGAFRSNDTVPHYTWVLPASENFDLMIMHDTLGHVSASKTVAFQVAGPFPSSEAAELALQDETAWYATYRELRDAECVTHAV